MRGALGEFWAQTLLRRRQAAAGSDAPSAAQNGRGQALQQDVRQALHVGVFAWLGMLAGLLAKVVLGCMMVGVFVVALTL